MSRTDETSTNAEVRQHADGRTAVRTPVTIDDVVKGACDWMAFSFIGDPQTRLHVELLTHDEVRNWTLLVPAGQCNTEARDRMAKHGAALRGRANPDGTRKQVRTDPGEKEVAGGSDHEGAGDAVA